MVSCLVKLLSQYAFAAIIIIIIIIITTVHLAPVICSNFCCFSFRLRERTENLRFGEVSEAAFSPKLGVHSHPKNMGTASQF